MLTHTDSEHEDDINKQGYWPIQPPNTQLDQQTTHTSNA
jgi:hypothetical protein